jgi:hypothetical protein
MGKGKSGSDSQSHDTAPLSSLKDPASFGPPPKRVPGQALPPPTSLRSTAGGLGAPLSAEDVEAQRRRKQEAAEADLYPEEETQAPSGPYRPDTTGLTTTGLPLPPRRAGQPASPPPAASGKPKPPSLPPRLPPRTTQHTDPTPPPRAAQPVASAPQPYTSTATLETASPSDGHLNQGAMSRLGQAGISVPGFGIGNAASPTVAPRSSNAPPTPTSPTKGGGQLSELQARFSKMNTTQSPTSSTGTTWAEKQAALRTAGDFKKDPTSVSFADARMAASTANNFRERHGEQVASGYQAANSMNQKYGLMEKAKSYGGNADSPTASSPTSPGFGGAGGKKAPPPPPAKRRDLMADPPPVPLSSKPKASG